MDAWFKKAPDGTNIIRHENVETKLGVTKGTAGFAQAREAVYERLFGKPLSVSHELLPLVPHIDVYTFNRPQGNREIYSLVTGGMSDLEMTLPRGADKDVPRRVELIFYCSEPRDEYIATLRWVAHFPHNTRSWLGHGHTMPNGDPPAPFWGSTELDTLFFLPPHCQEGPDATVRIEFGRRARSLSVGSSTDRRGMQFQADERIRRDAELVSTESASACV